jgi:preprotein translocase subunit SecA
VLSTPERTGRARGGFWLVFELRMSSQAVIVDTNTGRLCPDRRWSDNIHQAVEAKEGLEILNASVAIGTTTFQRFFQVPTIPLRRTPAITHAPCPDALYRRCPSHTPTPLIELAPFTHYDLERLDF